MMPTVLHREVFLIHVNNTMFFLVDKSYYCQDGLLEPRADGRLRSAVLSHLAQRPDENTCKFSLNIRGPRWQSGNTLASTSEAGVQFPARPQVGKLVVACRWSAVYNTEP